MKKSEKRMYREMRGRLRRDLHEALEKNPCLATSILFSHVMFVKMSMLLDDSDIMAENPMNTKYESIEKLGKEIIEILEKMGFNSTLYEEIIPYRFVFGDAVSVAAASLNNK